MKTILESTSGYLFWSVVNFGIQCDIFSCYSKCSLWTYLLCPTLTCPLSVDLSELHRQAPWHPGFWLGEITGDRGRRSEAGVFAVLAPSWSHGLRLACPSAEGLSSCQASLLPGLSSHGLCNCSLPSPAGPRTFHCCLAWRIA